MDRMAATILMPMVSYAQAPPSTQTPISPKIEQLDPRACANSGVFYGCCGIAAF